jgi:hypothetical protein
MMLNKEERVPYLKENHHWLVKNANDLSRVFLSLQELSTPNSFIALAEGAWPREVLATLSPARKNLSKLPRPALVREFVEALVLPISESQMADLAALADHHATPEIALHLAAFTADGPWLEWFDAPGDPIAVALTIPKECIARFATEVGGTFERAHPVS